MIAFLKNEIKRCKAAMQAADPTSEAYMRALQALREIQYALWREEDDGHGMGCTPPPPAEVEPMNGPDPAEDHPRPALAGDADAYDKITVRAALAQARNEKGVDVSKLLSGIGYDSFPSVPKEKYGELMAALSKELEGK